MRVCLWFFTLLTFFSFYFKAMGNKESGLQTKRLIKYFLLYINAHVSNDQHKSVAANVCSELTVMFSRDSTYFTFYPATQTIRTARFVFISLVYSYFVILALCLVAHTDSMQTQTILKRLAPDLFQCITRQFPTVMSTLFMGSSAEGPFLGMSV